MGTNTLTRAPSGVTDESHLNQIVTALSGDIVPRNATGAPVANSENAGSPTLPFGEIRAGTIFRDGEEFRIQTDAARKNRVISGQTRTTSRQSSFLRPAGAGNGRSVTILATSVDLVFNVNGTEYTLTTDTVKSSLTAAPSTNNTASVDAVFSAGDPSSKTYGEFYASGTVSMDAAQSEVTSKIGSWQAFKTAGDEILFGYVNSSTGIYSCYRGFFVDDNGDPINREEMEDNDTLTILKLAWLFLGSDLTTVSAIYTNPSWSATAPTSPATNDFWYDVDNQTWKTYNGSAWVAANAVFIGWAVCDQNDCIAARSVDFYADVRGYSSVVCEKSSNSTARIKYPLARANIYGADIRFGYTLDTWDMATHLADSVDMYDATEQNDRIYYLYLSDLGEKVISDIEPYYRPDLLGLYHPHNTWRAVGYARNDGSGNIAQVGTYPAHSLDSQIEHLMTLNASTTWTSSPADPGSEESSNGGAVRLEGGYFRFTRAGFYRISAFVQITKTSSNNEQFTIGIYDATSGVFIASQYVWDSEFSNTLVQGMHYRDTFRIDFLSHDYYLAFQASGGNYSGHKAHILIYQLPSIGL